MSNLPPSPPRRPKQSFVGRNVVALTMIPAIVAFHFGWYLLQQNRTLVSEREEIELPVLTFAKYCYKSLTERQQAAVENNPGAAIAETK